MPFYKREGEREWEKKKKQEGKGRLVGGTRRRLSEEIEEIERIEETEEIERIEEIEKTEEIEKIEEIDRGGGRAMIP